LAVLAHNLHETKRSLQCWPIWLWID